VASGGASSRCDDTAHSWNRSGAEGQPLDHRHLNLDVADFAYGRVIPTAEALAVWVWRRLEPQLPAGVRLHAVRIEEDDDLSAEYFGES
jgi:6-pyruvoyltetrahydropterin/6-carboxytetrahydropterin synthase